MHRTYRWIIAAILSATAGAAAADIAGNVTIATDYRFRGISQTDRDPAIQGGFDLTTEVGLYVGAWASNINFDSIGGGDPNSETGTIEMDYYGGFRGTISEGVTYDLGYLYYDYPSHEVDVDLDYQEFYAKLTFVGVTLGANYSSDYFAETGGFWYLSADYSIPFGETIALGLHAALNQWEDEEDFAAFGLGDTGDDEDNYIDYSVKLSVTEFGVVWALAYVGTDLDEDECFAGSKLCDPMAVLSVTKSL